MRCLFLFFSLFLIVSSILSAQEGFYQNGREGYYWYQDDVLEKAYDPEFPELVPDRYTYEELWELHPEKLAKMVKNRFNLAIQKPTEENAYRYLEVQDVAVNKSSAVAGVMGLVSQKRPTFRSEGIYPTSKVGQTALVKMKMAEINGILNSNRSKFALIVFETPGCEFCITQRPIMDMFAVTYGWNIKYLELSKYQELAEKYSVTMTPSIIMVERGKADAMPISSGVITLAELKKRVMRAIRYVTGENKPEQWYKQVGVSDPLKFVNKGGAN